MKISLCAVEQRLNDKVFNMKQIEKYAKQEAEMELTCVYLGRVFCKGLSV